MSKCLDGIKGCNLLFRSFFPFLLHTCLPRSSYARYPRGTAKYVLEDFASIISMSYAPKPSILSPTRSSCLDLPWWIYGTNTTGSLSRHWHLRLRTKITTWLKDLKLCASAQTRPNIWFHCACERMNSFADTAKRKTRLPNRRANSGRASYVHTHSTFLSIKTAASDSVVENNISLASTAYTITFWVMERHTVPCRFPFFRPCPEARRLKANESWI